MIAEKALASEIILMAVYDYRTCDERSAKLRRSIAKRDHVKTENARRSLAQMAHDYNSAKDFLFSDESDQALVRHFWCAVAGIDECDLQRINLDYSTRI